MDGPVDVRLDPVDHLRLGVRDRRHDHGVARVRAQRCAGVADVPGGQHACVSARGERLDERGPLRVELGLGSLEQDGHQHARPEVRLGQLLGA